MIPNSDSLNFQQQSFSLREEDGIVFWRMFAEQAWFFPFGSACYLRDYNAVEIRVLGEAEPCGETLNREISERIPDFVVALENAFEDYVRDIGIEDFRERAKEMQPYFENKEAKELAKDLVHWSANQILEGRQVHRLCDLGHVFYKPSTKQVGLLFGSELESYYGDHNLSLILSGEDFEFGIGEVYWRIFLEA